LSVVSCRLEGLPLKKIEAFIRNQAFESIRSDLSIYEGSEEEIAAGVGSDQ
jgi:hypothetical protein